MVLERCASASSFRVRSHASARENAHFRVRSPVRVHVPENENGNENGNVQAMSLPA